MGVGGRPVSSGSLGGPQPLAADVTVHPDAGYDYRTCWGALAERGVRGEIAYRGAGADPGRPEMGRRMDQLLVQRLRLAPAL